MKYQIKHEAIGCKRCGNDARINLNAFFAWASCKGCSEMGPRVQRAGADGDYSDDEMKEFMMDNDMMSPAEVLAISRWNEENDRSGK